MIPVRYAAVPVVLALVLAGTGFLVAPTGGEEVSPVPFDQTLITGMAGVDVEQAEAAGHVVPRAEVFYSQYEYVVGYYGLDSVAVSLRDEQRPDQFGQPLAVFVTALDGTAPSLTDEGYLTLDNSLAQGWVRAGDAWFVVDSGARTPAGPTPVPFASRDAATQFADQYDGRVVGWETVVSRASDSQITTDPTELVDARTAWADRTVRDARELRGRPTSMVVGEDAETVGAAIDQAPPNTTVVIPPGRYAVNLTVEKPITIRGAGNETVLDAGGTGSALTVRSPRAVVRSLRITGVGDVGIRRGDDDGGGWDERIRLIYGQGDAGIRLADATDSLIENVTVETPTNGIVLLNSSGTAVRNVAIRGTDDWRDGFMGILAMYSRVVVEDSVVHGGRDGVYTHYSDGIVVRDNRMEDLRYGVHEMYTSDVLIANNTVREANVGIILMTRPSGNVVTANDIRDSALGLATAGSASFVTRNVLVDTEVGISMSTRRSVYARNTVVRNGVGIRAATLLPTNSVVANDVIDNDRAVEPGRGTLEIWAENGRGNFWGRVPGMDRDGDGIVDRSYRPADSIESGAAHSPSAYSLAHSPTLGLVREFQGAVPGLRQSGIVDPAPLARPVRPGVLTAVNATVEGQP